LYSVAVAFSTNRNGLLIFSVLHSLDAVGDLQKLAGGLFGVGIWSSGGEFHPVSLSRAARANAISKSV
jgi:hypothetical protein